MSARYAVWKGEELLAIGTAKELAQRFGVKSKTVRWWASPAAKKRAYEGHHYKGRKVAERI